MRYFQIDGVHYRKDELIAKAEAVLKDDTVAEWEQLVWQFILNWFSDEEAVEVQTSGSTGAPKKMKIQKHYFRNSARMTLDFLGLKPGDSVLLCLSAGYIAGKMMIVRALEGGLNLILSEPSSNPMKAINQSVDFAAMVPMQVEKVLNESGEFALLKVRKLIIGGAAISPELEQQLLPLKNQVFATYGMTETVSHVALRSVSGTKCSAAFQPLAGVEISKDERGCLMINAPRLAAEMVITNDVVEINSDETFQILGRIDNVINSGGVKVFPEAVERKISHLIGDRFIITAQQNVLLGQQVTLRIETDNSEKYDWVELQNKIKEVVHPFECPKSIEFVKVLNETATGKIIRR
ncbi:hypothetical protein EMN47_07745 [Prolixibacteraceae bacterium JC049]|nr:hypothetical protein [Prolixibacteraceae bacterium JC049]